MDLGRETWAEADDAGDGFVVGGERADEEADDARVVATEDGRGDAGEARVEAAHAARELVAEAAQGGIVAEVERGVSRRGQAGSRARALAAAEQVREDTREDLVPGRPDRPTAGVRAPLETLQ